VESLDDERLYRLANWYIEWLRDDDPDVSDAAAFFVFKTKGLLSNQTLERLVLGIARYSDNEYALPSTTLIAVLESYASEEKPVIAGDLSRAKTRREKWTIIEL